MKMKIAGKRAIYQEKGYEFQEYKGIYALILEDENDLEFGFEKIEEGYRKLVTLEEVDFVFEKKSTILYQGEEFQTSIIKNNEILLSTRDRMLAKKYHMMPLMKKSIIAM